MEFTKELFTERVAQARQKAGVTVKELQTICGVSSSVMSKYVNGHVVPPLNVVCAMAGRLDVSIDWLCGLSDKPKQSTPEITTYGDLARTILAIEKKDVRWAKGGTSSMFVFLNAEIREFGEATQAATKITIADSTLYDFFVKYQRYSDMARESEDDRELVEAWVENQLQKLDKKVIVDNDALPF